MLNFLEQYPFWSLLFFFFGALFTWFAAEQFRDQILSDSHRVVRQVALRYLQVLIGFFAVFAFGIVLVLLTLLGSFARSVGEVLSPLPAAATAVVQATPFAIETPLSAASAPVSELNLPALPTASAASLPAPTETAPPTDDTLGQVQTAVVVNTNEVGANARDVPGLGGAVLTVVPEGTTVTMQGETTVLDGFTWMRVVLPDGTQAWIASRFLELTSE